MRSNHNEGNDASFPILSFSSPFSISQSDLPHRDNITVSRRDVEEGPFYQNIENQNTPLFVRRK